MKCIFESCNWIFIISHKWYEGKRKITCSHFYEYWPIFRRNLRKGKVCFLAFYKHKMTGSWGHTFPENNCKIKKSKDAFCAILRSWIRSKGTVVLMNTLWLKSEGRSSRPSWRPGPMESFNSSSIDFVITPATEKLSSDRRWS